MPRWISATSALSICLIVAGCGPGNDGSDADASRGETTTTIPDTASADGQCDDEQANKTGSHDHVEPGTEMEYTGVPPVSGLHWAEAPDIGKRLYLADERPELGELVHSQEHGWTIVWYDDSIPADDAALTDAAQGVDDADSTKVVFMPWTADDGQSFPDRAHIAITHWGTADDGTEYRQFCRSPSAAAVLAFSERHPYTDSPEPDAP